MERRNRDVSSSARVALPKPTTVSMHSHSRPKPFEYLHSVPQTHLSLTSYDALLDQNASHYFTSASMVKHCRQLEQIVKHPSAKEKSTSLIKMGLNLRHKKKQVQGMAAKLQHKSSFIENEVIKVSPYAASLGLCSRANLNELKRNLNQKLIVKQQQHQQFLKTQYNIKSAPKPQIRLVTTLEPLENMDVLNRQYIRTHKLLERSRITHSVNA